MKYLWLMFFCLGISSEAFADKHSVDWIFQQYIDKNDESVYSSAKGKIDNQDYLVLLAIRTTMKSEYQPAILVFKKFLYGSKLIAKIDLEGDSIQKYSVAIKKNSIYVESSIGHHGWHDMRFRFKLIKKKFKLVSEDYQSMQLGCYADNDTSSCSSYEVWSGVRRDFLNRSVFCWRDSFNPSNKKRWNDVSNRFKNWQKPNRGVSHLQAIRPIQLPPLDGFNLLEFRSPRGCYFDKNNRLRR